MALHLFLPLVAGGLMATVWVSTLGGGTQMWLSGAAIGAIVFWILLKARHKADLDQDEEAAKR